jgi:hypothetical protein
VKKSRFTEAQIIGVLREQEAGGTTGEVCRRHGISQQNPFGNSRKFKRFRLAARFHRWQSGFSLQRKNVFHRFIRRAGRHLLLQDAGGRKAVGAKDPEELTRLR